MGIASQPPDGPANTSSSPEPTVSDRPGGPRLGKEDALARWVRGAFGHLLAYPWFDRLSLWMLSRYYFPLSRMWAAATVSGGEPERFLAEAPLSPAGIDLRRLQSVLTATETAGATAAEVDAAWREVFFGDKPCSVDRLVAIESARRDSQHALNSMRWKYRFLLDRKMPIIRAETPSPSEVAAVYADGLHDRRPFYQPPSPMPVVEQSRKVPGAVGTEYWLRFPSPSSRLDDVVHAHVYEPEGVKDPPSIIFGHGIGVEFDMWHGLIDEVNALCRMGLRVIRPEAPWHGRRRPRGRYSGEYLVARAPMGSLDVFTGALREWSVLIDWARATSSGRVAVGGSSMGALMSLMCADVSRDWPRPLRPEALLLITPSGRMQDALLHGDLARTWKSRESMLAKGWTSENSDSFMPILNPRWDTAPVVDPEHIVSVIGTYDRVTPFESALGLLDAWKVPKSNSFVWRRGHFSVPMTMIRNTAPITTFGKIMLRCDGA